MLHLSTCYVAGQRDGRVSERVRLNYTPAHLKNFDSEKEWRRLHELVESAEARAEGPEVTEELKQQALGKEHAAKGLSGQALENQIRKNRVRWLKNYLTEEATRRANELGWPNTYTFTKSLAESLIAKHGAGLPIAIVRPSIVETSVTKPFRGWNEGINTSASLSYLLGTTFPAATFQPAQAAGHYSGGCRVRGDDADWRGAGGAAARSDVSTRDVGDESLRHGTVD